MDDPLRAAARSRPSHPAVVADGRAVSYAELDRAVDATARRLAALGVRAGDRVATTLPAGHAFAELLHALPRVAAAIVPLNTRLTAAEMRLQAELSRARFVVEERLTGEEADVELGAIDPQAVHSVVFTSGTGGRPRPVELTWGNHRASAEATAEALRIETDERWLCPLPLFHVGGLAVLLRSSIYGTTALLHDGFDAARVTEELESGAATYVSLVPTMLRRLREAGLERAPALRAVLLGGGPVPDELIRWAAELDLPVRPSYGMTETASQVATAAVGEPAGIPLRGVDLEISAEGEILVRGPMVADGALAPDGWLHTGDRGRLDGDGRLHVEGRLKELIVTGGEKVSPAEVEEVLLAHPAVADAGVVGLPDPEWGEAVSAFVVLREPLGLAELTRWCRGRLAAHKVPKRIDAVSELPRNAAGKLVRELLTGGEQTDSSATDKLTTYSSDTYTARYPSDWTIAEDNVLKTSFSRTKFVSSDGSQSVLIDRSPGEDVLPADKAVEVERGTRATSGYERISFQETTIAGRPAFEWTFRIGSERKIDIFLNIDGDGFAILGEGSDFDDVLAVARRVAQSLEPL